MIPALMVYHANPFQGAARKVKQARAFLDFPAENTPTTSDGKEKILRHLVVSSLPDLAQVALLLE